MSAMAPSLMHNVDAADPDAEDAPQEHASIESIPSHAHVETGRRHPGASKIVAALHHADSMARASGSHTGAHHNSHHLVSITAQQDTFSRLKDGETVKSKMPRRLRQRTAWLGQEMLSSLPAASLMRAQKYCGERVIARCGFPFFHVLLSM